MSELTVLPEPLKITVSKSRKTAAPSSLRYILFSEACAEEAAYLEKRLRTEFSARLERRILDRGKNLIVLSSSPTAKETPEPPGGGEAFLLSATENGALLAANDRAGLFYAAESVHCRITGAPARQKKFSAPA
jgi:N-acetyl-beta-hexosaminidase